MISKLLQRPAAVEVVGPRDQLRQAQARAKTARNAAHRAAHVAEQGRAAVARAQSVAATYASLDDQVATFRADGLRNGATTTELPRNLVDGRRRQQVAQLELDDAQRAAGRVEQDAIKARAALAEAETELRLAVDAVLQCEAVALVGRMRFHEQAAAADRVLLVGFFPIRRMDDPPVTEELLKPGHDPIHPYLIDVALAARVPAGGPVWQDLQARLLTDADAELGNA